MKDNNTIPTAPLPDAPAEEPVSAETPDREVTTPEAPAPEPRHARITATVCAFVLTILAWVLLPWIYWAALAAGIAAVVVSVIALRQPRGAWRNLALVSIVAAAVLLLVLAVFWTGIYFLSTL